MGELICWMTKKIKKSLGRPEQWTESNKIEEGGINQSPAFSSKKELQEGWMRTAQCNSSLCVKVLGLSFVC